MSAHRGITTLKDVFPEIKKEYKRNFLRENKIKIKDIQNDVKTKKQVEKERKDELEKRKHRLQERLARNTARTPHKVHDTESLRRSKSGLLSSSKTNECVCGFKLDSPPISAKSTTSIDKEIQTDYTIEETFRSFKSIKSSENIIPALQVDDSDETEVELPGNLPAEEDINVREQNVERAGKFENHSPKISHRVMSAHDQRLESLSNPFLYKEKIDYLKPYHELPKVEDLNNKFDKIKIDDEVSVTHQELEKKKSARSIMSTRSNRTAEIKLPKYLEKEKREKELQKMRELAKDPNCPDGFALLDEKIRLENLEVLQKGFQSLVDELNRLPMSSVTLRVKTRRNEIEKDLVDLENKIRFYEKPKIYVKSTDSIA